MDLFAASAAERIESQSPLANRMRPRTLDEFFGQTHIVGPGRLLRRAIQADQLSSVIFYGPPGTGKTTLARIIANTTESHFITLNAVLSGVKDMRAAIADAKRTREQYGRRTTLFVDEVHRWNKAQQDALLPHVENGVVILIGATTENPYFEVNKALVSRSRIFQLTSLDTDDMRDIVARALNDTERGLGDRHIRIADDALTHLVEVANGDARALLNALELAATTSEPTDDGTIEITLDIAEESIQRRAVLYDKDGDAHYDTISAFIKSLRGSDPDASLYWMAKMLYAGEDPNFIFRRMSILASEDIGLADPEAVSIVLSCWQAYERLGMPEGRFPLSQAALYLATCQKSNSTMALFDALRTVESEREGEVPSHLKDASRDGDSLGHGQNYSYPHAFKDHWVAQQYLPEAYRGRSFYTPSDNGYEGELKRDIERRKEVQIAAMAQTDDTSAPASAPSAERLRWLERSMTTRSKDLELLRDHVFDGLRIAREATVLDLNAQMGLLTWEAMRLTPGGGVWTLAQDDNAARHIEQAIDRLPALDRPEVLRGQLATLAELFDDSGHDGLRFDGIIGLNPLSSLRDTEITPVLTLLAKTGQLSIVQRIPPLAQRIYSLIHWPSDLQDLHDHIVAIEDGVYAVQGDDWDIDSFVDVLRGAGSGDVDCEAINIQSTRMITSELLDRWFGAADQPPGGSYRNTLTGNNITNDDVDRVAKLYRDQVANKSVTWTTSYRAFRLG